MRTVKLVLIRHGESEWNKDNRFCGWHDAGLSSKGKSDAVKIAARALKDHNLEFDCAYTSALKRAQQSLKIVLQEIKCENIPITYDWHLNERHYGNLTGFNKREVADKYGEHQVQIWRRSFDVLPPEIQSDNPYYFKILNNPSFKNIPRNEFPYSESLSTVIERVVPFFENEILNDIGRGKRVLVVVHGTVARSLVKHISDISDEDITKVNVPNSIPIVYEFNVATKERVGDIEYLADPDFLREEIAKTASIGPRGGYKG